jgi:hypothetical protein
LEHVLWPKPPAIGARRLPFWESVTIGNQQVITKPTRSAPEGKLKPAKTNRLNQNNQNNQTINITDAMFLGEMDDPKSHFIKAVDSESGELAAFCK